MANVPHAIGMAQQRETMILISQPRGLDRKLRSELIGFSRCFILPNAYRRRHFVAEETAGERIPTGLHLLSLLWWILNATCLASLQAIGIDGYGEIYRRASSRPSGFVLCSACRGAVSV